MAVPQQILSGFNAAAAGSSYLLDDYPTAAAAYSFVLLKSTYSGALCRVRRSSDNTESDFYQGATVGSLNTTSGGGGTSLASWVGANNGFVVKWYDQSGNAIDAIQSTTAAQPKIVNSGSMLTSGGMPRMDFDGSDDVFNLGNVLKNAGSFTFFTVAKTSSLYDSSVIYAKSIAAGTPNRIAFFFSASNLELFAVDNSNVSQSVSSSGFTTRFIGAQIYADSSSHKGYSNGTLLSTDSTVGAFDSNNQSGNSYSFLIGAYNDASTGATPLAGTFFTGEMQLLVKWNSDQNSNVTAIDTLINNIYATH